MGSLAKEEADALASFIFLKFEASAKLQNNGALQSSITMADCYLDDKRLEAIPSTARLVCPRPPQY